jgi:hypothetical protein
VFSPRAIIDDMIDDNLQQGAVTSTDLSRHAATNDDSDYSLSVEEALARYEAAGVPRTPRSIQRYCAKGDLDAHRVEMPFGDKFLITPASVDRHIAYIMEVRPVARENKGENENEEAATSSDTPRQATTAGEVSHLVAAEPNAVSRYVAHLEGENAYPREQSTVKDGQIKDLTERARETNHLIAGLQKMLTPLLSASNHTRADAGIPGFLRQRPYRKGSLIPTAPGG